ITGENELTIGAKRLERPEDDVTLGTRDLSDLNRSPDELPGLEKTRTALSTEDTGASRDRAAILHLGGGNLDTFGGWGLLGQSSPLFQSLLSGGYSSWGGEPAGGGSDGEERYRLGFDGTLFPRGPWTFRFSGGGAALNAVLPYEGSQVETHRAYHLEGGAGGKLSDFSRLDLEVRDEQTDLSTWNGGQTLTSANEFQARGKVEFDEIDPFLRSLSLNGGLRKGSSGGFAPADAKGYRQEWLGASCQWKAGDLDLTTSLQGQEGGEGLDLPLRFYPSARLLLYLPESAQLEVGYLNSREVDDFQEDDQDRAHLSDAGGFVPPTEHQNEWSLKWTQKVSETAIFSVFGSDGEIIGYHQWSDQAGPGPPSYLQGLTTLGRVELRQAGANFQFDFDRDTALSVKYQWQQGLDPGDGRGFTDLPEHQVRASLQTGEEVWDAQLGFTWASSRRAFEDRPGDLPAYWTLDLSGDYHLDRAFGLWAKVENPLGETYSLQPGYEEPRFYGRAGVEFSF
ncbi:MAG TPA: hypothetical protein VFR02_07670, partial [bacterium]|nr:hypothetical protein [bacterium]